MFNNQNSFKKKNKRKGINSKTNGIGTSKASSSLLFRNAIMPLTHKGELQYVDSSMVRNNPGNNFIVWGMRINDLYDPDPAILSGSISGFKELMQFYGKYRVNTCHLEIVINNLEAFPINWGVIITNINVLGTIPTAAAALNLLENGYSTGARALSAKGGQDRDRQVINVNLHQLVGNMTVYQGDLDYTGTISTSPAISLWAFVIVVGSSGAVLSNGVSNLSKFTYSSTFFDRNILLA